MNVEEVKKLNTFEERYNYDVSKYIEQKTIEGTTKTGSKYKFTLSYLSWAYAHKIGMICDPKFKWRPVKNENGSLIHENMVLIEMTFLDETSRLYFPILDARNKSILNPNSFDVNTAQMRGMAKLFSMMSGFGLHLYTQEDIKNLELTGDDEGKQHNQNNNKTQKKADKNITINTYLEAIRKYEKEYQTEIKDYLVDKALLEIEDLNFEQAKELAIQIREKVKGGK